MSVLNRISRTARAWRILASFKLKESSSASQSFYLSKFLFYFLVIIVSKLLLFTRWFFLNSSLTDILCYVTSCLFSVWYGNVIFVPNYSFSYGLSCAVLFFISMVICCQSAEAVNCLIRCSFDYNSHWYSIRGMELHFV